MRPHDALGHPGRATGVEQPQVVAAAIDRRHRLGARQDVVERCRPLRTRMELVGSHAHERAEPREAGADLRQAVGELDVEDHRVGVRVLQQVRQLGTQVPVVDVDRRGPHLERCEGRDEVLGPVVHVQGDLAVRAHTGPVQVRCESSGLLFELAPGGDHAAVDERRGVGNRRRDRLPHRRQVHPVRIRHRAHSRPAPTSVGARTRPGKEVPNLSRRAERSDSQVVPGGRRRAAVGPLADWSHLDAAVRAIARRKDPER